ncbi:putative fatty acyl-CoA reductase CG8306 [Aricia agestis]|uniref:putative fatty acyl-CoA reductase CG8306 n=1 Tax=Aricia agestis TaxID=91739 RepID=UPI001C2037F9|nr:putative fatty acyl-CoA reductase CG8306 [Aricia agestis]XP_041970809.1 putative fatty acyl-CoA reductase CG8306 [Aricia agestis]XP_041970810.1 putative fatty acyl-CoA reductase CG8306 [Aricia agestis]XP_041970811.1 putative fatty acyl-CoA reductase CG8306 [Aricia agestis]
MSEESKVRAFYSGKNFFITGGTGFVGLCLIEKILRCIPDVGKVYLLMRPKKGKEINERLKEFHTNPVFEKLLEKETVEIFNKLVPIAGDVGSDDLAISPADRQVLIDNVNVVIHSAATLDFEENLRPTVNINILGTRRITELCQHIKNLKVLVHVSSAYVNSYLTETTEKLYDAPADVEKVIELSKTMSDQALLDIEKEVLKDHPNTYTFTKHLGEHEVNKCADKFPCTIVRPSMIVASWKEPIPGWTCSKVGPQGFLMGASKGVVRRLPMCETNIADYIPVDVVVNQLLVAGWKAAQDKSGLSIYHCTSSTQRPFRWGSLNEMINNYMHENPLKSAVWYPHLSFVPSLLMFRISAIFVHFLPAILLDTVLRLTGGKPILFRLHKNVWNSLGRLERFIFTEWRFHNDRTRQLAQELNDADQKLFFIDIAELNWDAYFKNLYLGVRKYLNRESEKTIPAARSKDNMLYYAHIVWQVLVIWLLWVLVATALRATLLTTPWAPVLIYFLYSFL